MWRSLLLAILLAFGAATAGARAEPFVGAWQVCDGRMIAGAPVLADCRLLQGIVDPQGRELWLRAPVRPKTAAETRPSAVYVFGAASSEFWFNGVRLGANGAPGATAEAERPGLYEAEFPIPPGLWRPDRQELVVRMSAFHVGARFDHPIGAIGIGRYPQPSRLPQVAVTFAAAGALLAAAFGFGAVYAM